MPLRKDAGNKTAIHQPLGAIGAANPETPAAASGFFQAAPLFIHLLIGEMENGVSDQFLWRMSEKAAGGRIGVDTGVIFRSQNENSIDGVVENRANGSFASAQCFF